MKKELITVDNVNNYICKQDGKLYVFGNRLLTAGAKDEMGRRRVTVVYGPEPVAAPAPAAALAASCVVAPVPPQLIGSVPNCGFPDSVANTAPVPVKACTGFVP